MSTPQKPTGHEKKPVESKKFLAWFLSEMSWKGIILAMLFWYKDELVKSGVGAGVWWFLLGIVITAGFIGIGFILGQAALDKYVRVAEIAANEVREKVTPGEGGKPESTESDPPTDPGAKS